METQKHELPEEGRNGLTGLLRREFFMRELFRDFNSRVSSGVENYSFVMLDVDDFKAVNDLYGSEQGNHILKRVGGIICGVYYSEKIEGTSCRYGGEEFVLALYGINVPTTLQISELVRENIELSAYPSAKDKTKKWEGRITASLGVTSARFSRTSKLSAEQRHRFLEKKINEAETAMKYAKFKGKNKVEFYSPFAEKEVERIKNVRKFYFENLFNYEKLHSLLSHYFMKSNPEIGRRILFHHEFAKSDLTPRDTRYLAKLADNVYSMIFSIPLKKEKFHELIS